MGKKNSSSVTRTEDKKEAFLEVKIIIPWLKFN